MCWSATGVVVGAGVMVGSGAGVGEGVGGEGVGAAVGAGVGGAGVGMAGEAGVGAQAVSSEIAATYIMASRARAVGILSGRLLGIVLPFTGSSLAWDNYIRLPSHRANAGVIVLGWNGLRNGKGGDGVVGCKIGGLDGGGQGAVVGEVEEGAGDVHVVAGVGDCEGAEVGDAVRGCVEVADGGGVAAAADE